MRLTAARSCFLLETRNRSRRNQPQGSARRRPSPHGEPCRESNQQSREHLALIAALQPTLVLDETGDGVDTLARAQIAEHERTRAAHALGVALHDRERGADVGREIDFVEAGQGAGCAARPSSEPCLLRGARSPEAYSPC